MARKHRVLEPDVESAGLLPEVSYRKRWAVLVGVDDYPNLAKDYQLANAVADAKVIGNLLQRDFGFETPEGSPLFDRQATKENIRALFGALQEKTQHDDAVLVFFAGHGKVHEGQGYLVPAGGRLKAPDSWLPAEEIIDACTRMPARHVLLIIDACFAGNFLKGRIKDTGSPENGGKTLQVLLAGTAREKVPDVSIFAQALREGLSGLADLNKDDVISADELIDYVVGQVDRHSADQQPLGGYLVRDVDTGGQLQLIWHVPHLPTAIVQDLCDPGHRHLGLSKLAEESPGYEGVLRDLAIGQFVQRGLDDPDKENARTAVQALGTLHARAVVDRLTPLLSDADLAPDAARALGQIGDERAIDALVSLLNGAAHEEARAAAATALGEIGHPDVTELLLRALGRWERMGSEDVWAVAGSPDTVRAAAARALGRLYSPTVVRDLLTAYWLDGSEEVRNAVADALRQMGGQATPALIEYLNRQDVHANVRVLVAEILGATRAKDAVPALRQALQTEGYGFVEAAAAHALGEIGDAEAASDLVAALDQGGSAGAAAAEALGRLNAPEAVPALIATLSAGWLDAAIQAAHALGRLGDERALEPLEAILRDPTADFAIREATAKALGDLGNRRAVPALREALIGGEIWHVCDAAASSLVLLEGADAVPTLLSLLDQAGTLGLLAAVQALAKLGDSRAVEPLRALLNTSENDRVRQAATEVVARLTQTDREERR